MTEQAILTQKDLDLVSDDAKPADAGAADDKSAKGGDDAGAGGKGAAVDDKAAAGGDDKGGSKKGSAGLFDDDDGDDSKGADDKPKTADDKGKDADDKSGDDSAKPKDGDDKSKDDKKDDKKDAPDWRQAAADRIMAGVKDKLTQAKYEKRRESILKQLGRHKDIESAVASGVLAQEKLRAGNKMPDDPEEVADWRKSNGIPDAPEGYDIPKIAGYTWSEADEPMIGSFKGVAHGLGLNQAQVNALVDWQIKHQLSTNESYDAEIARIDREDKSAARDAIREAYGVSEFKANMTVLQRFIEDEEVFGGSDTAEKLMKAKYFDEETGKWRRVMSIPAISLGFLSLAHDRYGEGALPSGDGRPTAAQDRKAEITKIMNTDQDRYFREGLADEMMEILRKEEERDKKRGRR